MESFFAPVQKNVLDRQRWPTRQQLRLALVYWIETTYHRRRRQRRLGELTPIEFEIDEHHWKCPRNALGASTKNARETVINLGYGGWVVSEVTCRGHGEVREGACEGEQEGQGPNSGSGGRGYWLVA